MTRKPTTYWDYIKTDELLSLQNGLARSDAELGNDEVMFITVHQIDELWFKLVLRELVTVRDLFARDRVPEESLASAVRGIRRMALLFHHLAGHFAVMETMTTRDYLAFRDKLFPASGFQSSGLREIEILLGLAESDRVPLGQEGGYLEALRSTDGSASNAYRRVVARLQDRPTLREAVDEWLYRTPIEGSTPDRPGDAERVGRFVDAYCDAHRREVEGQKQLAHFDGQRADDAARIDERYSQEVESARRFLLAEDAPAEERPRRSRIRVAVLFIESYRELPLLAWPREALDGIVALEQAFVIFRQRHARMVERMIGRRTGTGGSAGVEYIDRTALSYRVFRDVWAVRTVLLRKEALPPLTHADAYALPVED